MEDTSKFAVGRVIFENENNNFIAKDVNISKSSEIAELKNVLKNVDMLLSRMAASNSIKNINKMVKEAKRLIAKTDSGYKPSILR